MENTASPDKSDGEWIAFSGFGNLVAGVKIADPSIKEFGDGKI
jgi:hypothetical protein